MGSDNVFWCEPPKDANGEIIPLDTETLYETDGQVFHVLAFRYSPKGREWFASGGYTGNKNGWCAEANDFLLAPPDSWDKLIGDLRGVAGKGRVGMCKYLDPTGKGCIECRAQSYNSCSTCMIADIADRIEKLRESDDDYETR